MDHKFFRLISLWHVLFTHNHKFWQFRFDWWNGKRLLHLPRNQVNQIKWQNLAPNLSMRKASLKAKTRNTNLSDQLEGNQCRIRGCHSRAPTHPLPHIRARRKGDGRRVQTRHIFQSVSDLMAALIHMQNRENVIYSISKLLTGYIKS